MICVDPYLNATTRHADVILPPPSVLEKSHYDLAFTALSVRNVAHFSPPVFERAPGIAVGVRDPGRLAAIAAGLGADSDPACWPTRRRRARGRGGRRSGIVDPRPRSRTRSVRRSATGRPRRGSSISSSAPVIAATRSARGPAASRSRLLEAHPHGIDFGPLEPRLPDALATESGKVELAPPRCSTTSARLESALAVTAAAAWCSSAAASCGRPTRGRRTCTCSCAARTAVSPRLHPDDAARLGLVDGATATIRSAAGAIDDPRGAHRLRHARRRLRPLRLGSRPAGHAPGRRHRPCRRQREHPHRRLDRRPALGQCRAQRHPGHRRRPRNGARAGTIRPTCVRYTAAKPGIPRGTGARTA